MRDALSTITSFIVDLFLMYIASFIPPDVPQDDSMINTPSTCMDIDEDELHWQEWLADLMNPNPPSEYTHTN